MHIFAYLVFSSIPRFSNLINVNTELNAQSCSMLSPRVVTWVTWLEVLVLTRPYRFQPFSLDTWRLQKLLYFFVIKKSDAYIYLVKFYTIRITINLLSGIIRNLHIAGIRSKWRWWWGAPRGINTRYDIFNWVSDRHPHNLVFLFCALKK